MGGGFHFFRNSMLQRTEMSLLMDIGQCQMRRLVILLKMA
jgi:hypothetical protein